MPTEAELQQQGELHKERQREEKKGEPSEQERAEGIAQQVPDVHISFVEGGVLLMLAVGVDFIQLLFTALYIIPAAGAVLGPAGSALNFIISLLFGLSLFLYFLVFKGVSLLRARAFLRIVLPLAIGFITELIPGISWIMPTWTFSIIVILALSYAKRIFEFMRGRKESAEEPAETEETPRETSYAYE